jgi:putative ABC transport system permease protein
VDDNALFFRPWGQVPAVPDNIAVRLAGESRQLLPTIRGAFQAMDPSMPVASVRAVEDWIDGTLWNARFTTDVITAFAVFALLLASAGVYATVSYVVGRRRRELAIRLAVGATRQSILLVVLRSSAGIVVAGIVAGMIGSLGVSRALRATMPGIGGLEWYVLATVAASMLVTGFGAAYLPARRASRADPAAILRSD